MHARSQRSVSDSRTERGCAFTEEREYTCGSRIGNDTKRSRSLLEVAPFAIENHCMSPRIVTVTVSDTRTEADDFSGRALAEELAAFTLVRHLIVPDEPDRITALVEEIVSSGETDAIIFSGGTGITARDRTIEALESTFEKKLDGFGETFRRISWDQVGARAMLSRATAGTVGVCIVFALPGSEKGVRLGVRELIVPILAHVVDLLQGRTVHKPKLSTRHES